MTSFYFTQKDVERLEQQAVQIRQDIVSMIHADGVILAQGVEDGRVKVPPAGQSGVHHRAGVALGEDKPVPVGPLGIFRVDVHHVDGVRHADGWSCLRRRATW